MPTRKKPSPLPNVPHVTVAALIETFHQVSEHIAARLHQAIVANDALTVQKLSTAAGIAVDRIKDLEELPAHEATAVSPATIAAWRLATQLPTPADATAKRTTRLDKWLPRTIQELGRLQEALFEDRILDVHRWAIALNISAQKVARYAAQTLQSDADRHVMREFRYLAYQWRHEGVEDVVRLLQLRGVPPKRLCEVVVALTVAAFHYQDPTEPVQPGTLLAYAPGVRQAWFQAFAAPKGVPA